MSVFELALAMNMRRAVSCDAGTLSRRMSAQATLMTKCTIQVVDWSPTGVPALHRGCQGRTCHIEASRVHDQKLAF